MSEAESEILATATTTAPLSYTPATMARFFNRDPVDEPEKEKDLATAIAEYKKWNEARRKIPPTTEAEMRAHVERVIKVRLVNKDFYGGWTAYDDVPDLAMCIWCVHSVNPSNREVELETFRTVCSEIATEHGFCHHIIAKAKNFHHRGEPASLDALFWMADE